MRLIPWTRHCGSEHLSRFLTQILNGSSFLKHFAKLFLSVTYIKTSLILPYICSIIYFLTRNLMVIVSHALSPWLFCTPTKCHLTKCHLTKCHLTKCHLTKCHLTKCHITKCHRSQNVTLQKVTSHKTSPAIIEPNYCFKILKNLLIPSHNALLGLAGSPGPPPGERGDHHQIREEEDAPLLPARQGHYHSGVKRTLTGELQADNGYGRLEDEIDYENKTDKDTKRWSLIKQYKDTLQLLEWQDKDNCSDKMELYTLLQGKNGLQQ